MMTEREEVEKKRHDRRDDRWYKKSKSVNAKLKSVIVR